MKKLWITYAWVDNEDKQVDFIAQEIEKCGVSVKLDKWTIKAGERLWEQIDRFISRIDECDAWAIVATQNSLGSEPCKEEIAYALQRALSTRGASFPVIGIFPGTVSDDLIPSAIKTRLYVSLKDPDWVERICASVEGRQLNIARESINPCDVTWKGLSNGKFLIEIRPRAGTWLPFVVFLPEVEISTINPEIHFAPKGIIPQSSVLNNFMQGTMPDIERGMTWWFTKADNEASPTMSYYVVCDSIPTKLICGKDGGPHCLITLK